MTDGDHVDDLVAPYALGALEPDELEHVEAHLAVCPTCRRAVEETKAITDQLAHAVPVLTPPAHLRAEVLRRLDERIPVAVGAATPDPRPPTPAWWVRWWRPVAMGSAAASLVLAAVLAMTTMTTQQELQAEREQVRAMAPRVTQEAQLVSMTVAPLATAVPLRPALEQSAAKGKLLVDDQQGRALLVVHQLPALPDNLAYQIWLSHDSERKPAGTFRVNRDGSATVEMSMPNDLASYRWIWVTVEPAEGSPEPQGEMVLVATL